MTNTKITIDDVKKEIIMVHWFGLEIGRTEYDGERFNELITNEDVKIINDDYINPFSKIGKGGNHFTTMLINADKVDTLANKYDWIHDVRHLKKYCIDGRYNDFVILDKVR